VKLQIVLIAEKSVRLHVKTSTPPSSPPSLLPSEHVAQLPSSCGLLRISLASGQPLHFRSDSYSPSLSPNALVEPPRSLAVLPLIVFLLFLSLFRMTCQRPRAQR